MKLTYRGPASDVVLGDRVLHVDDGDVVDVTGDDAKALDGHPCFTRAAKKASSKPAPIKATKADTPSDLEV